MLCVYGNAGAQVQAPDEVLQRRTREWRARVGVTTRLPTALHQNKLRVSILRFWIEGDLLGGEHLVLGNIPLS